MYIYLLHTELKTDLIGLKLFHVNHFLKRTTLDGQKYVDTLELPPYVTVERVLCHCIIEM